MLVFAAWPQFWDAQAGLTPAGLVWYGPATYFATGDQPWYHEFHWHGLQLLAGNSFVLAGLAGLAALAVAAVLGARARLSDDASLAELRERLVTEVLATSGIRDERIAAALRDVPRHLFLPHLPPEEAYLDDAIVTKRDAEGQPISSSSQPAIMAIMLDQLDLAPGQRVLEIGAGTGYNAALISHIVGRRAPWSASTSKPTWSTGPASTWPARVPGRHRGGPDGAEGYPPGAPYDRVIATVGVSDLAPAWLTRPAPTPGSWCRSTCAGRSWRWRSGAPARRRRARWALGEPVHRAVRVHADARLAGRPGTHRGAAAGAFRAAPGRAHAGRRAGGGRRGAGRLPGRAAGGVRHRGPRQFAAGLLGPRPVARDR